MTRDRLKTYRAKGERRLRRRGRRRTRRAVAVAALAVPLSPFQEAALRVLRGEPRWPEVKG